MALTQGNWSKTTTANGYSVWECDVTATTAENDAYTKVIDFINPEKPWYLIANTAGATMDASALPIDIWVGWTNSGLTGDAGTVAWTSGYGCQAAAGVIDDAKSTAVSVKVIPGLTVAPVASTLAGVRGYVCVTPAPYIALNANGGSTLNAATIRFSVIQ